MTFIGYAITSYLVELFIFLLKGTIGRTHYQLYLPSLLFGVLVGDRISDTGIGFGWVLSAVLISASIRFSCGLPRLVAINLTSAQHKAFWITLVIEVMGMVFLAGLFQNSLFHANRI
jgi:hypothetical protein